MSSLLRPMSEESLVSQPTVFECAAFRLTVVVRRYGSSLVIRYDAKVIALMGAQVYMGGIYVFSKVYVSMLVDSVLPWAA